MTVHAAVWNVCVCVCSWFLSLAASPMTSHSSGWLPTAGRTCSLLRIPFFLLLAVPSAAVPEPATLPVLHYTPDLCVCDIVSSDEISSLSFISCLPFSLSLSLLLPLLSLYLSPSLTLCCLNKVAFIRMSRNPNRPNKRYGRGNLIVPACQLATPPPTHR